jgi:hypothetical protein
MARTRAIFATFAAMLFLFAGFAIAAAQTSSGAPPAVTVLGAAAAAASGQSAESDSGGVTVLRGSRPVPTPAPTPPPASVGECPQGYVDSGSAGCVPQDYAEEPIYDLSWPFFVSARHRQVRHPAPAFVHRRAISGVRPPPALPRR